MRGVRLYAGKGVRNDGAWGQGIWAGRMELGHPIVRHLIVVSIDMFVCELVTLVTFVTGHEDPARPQTRIDWRALAQGIDTLVFLMGVGRLAVIAGELIAHGRPGDTPAAVVHWGTMPEQVTITGTLATIAGDAARANLTTPATLIVGEVVRLRERLSWFDTLPRLGGRLAEERRLAMYAIHEG